MPAVVISALLPSSLEIQNIFEMLRYARTGRPEDSGIALQTVQELGAEFPIFGVCMGHQCIGQVFGGNIIKAPSGVMHGKTSPVHHTNQGLMKVRVSACLRKIACRS